MDRLTARYTNAATANQCRAELSSLFGFAGAGNPRMLSDAAVNHWVAQDRANNTRRGRLARACTFLRGAYGWARPDRCLPQAADGA
ncbi:MAG: hypothetical protein M3Y91_07145 [Actinomycetota bacterium]|nr:hypothetical protein [Actinomycetota bacterium]